MSSSAVAAVPSEVRDPALADKGKRRIEWALQSMPVLQGIRKNIIKTQPFAQHRIAACLHITPEVANLLITLRDGGAHLVLCAAGLSSTQDDVAASLVKDYNVPVYGFAGETRDVFEAHLALAIAQQPQIVIDDGSALSAALHTKYPEALPELIGGTEESAGGTARLRAAGRKGTLSFPVISVYDAANKQLLDNRWGTGQTTLEAICRTTGILLAGLSVVVVGFGACGKGIAARAAGLGANVTVCEVDPMRALEAVMAGYRVTAFVEAASFGDVFVTVSGNKNVIHREHFDKFKNGAILCNAGYSNVEIDIDHLSAAALSRRLVRDMVEELAMRDGRRLYLLREGRPIHGEILGGQPSAVLDVSLATHALSAEYLIKWGSTLPKTVTQVPVEIDRLIAKIKLESMNVKIDRLSVDQEQYLASWAEGA